MQAGADTWTATIIMVLNGGRRNTLSVGACRVTSLARTYTEGHGETRS